MKTEYVFLFMLLLLTSLKAQDSLYLVKTLEGEPANILYFAKGLGDINGDGYSDLIVEKDSTTIIYLGNSEFELEPDIIYPDRKFYQRLGDINNDGYDDIIIGSKLYYGGEQLDSSTTYESPPYYYMQSISRYVGEIGDVNGDGYKDFVISSPYNWSNGISFVYLYLGGDSVSSDPFVTFYHSPFEDPTSEGTYGKSVAGVGDVNNDGYDDILIGDPKNNGVSYGPGKVYLYYGGENMDNIADSILTDDSDHNFGSYIKNGGDIDKDGINELIITSLSNVYFYKGLKQYLKIDASQYGFGGHVNVGSNGDINNDGYDDYIIGNTNYLNDNDTWVGGAFLFYGSSEEDTTYDYHFEGEYRSDQFGMQTEIIGDYNGDGYDDFFVLAPSYPDLENPQGKLYIYSYQNVTDIKEEPPTIVNKFELAQNYPNPFNPSTTISYRIPSEVKSEKSKVKNVVLKVFDILGREIVTLVDENQKPGNYEVEFNSHSGSVRNLTSGVYFYRLQYDNFSQIKKMILIR